MPKIWSSVIDRSVIGGIDALTRVEPTASEVSLEHGLEARIADPLWLLARQWQFGELRGEDAASPVQVDVELDVVPVQARTTATQGGLPNVASPIEPLVETEEVLAAGGPGALWLAAELGLLARRELGGTEPGPKVWAGLRASGQFGFRAEALAQADPATRLLARRSLDGVTLAAWIDQEGPLDSRLATLTKLDSVATQFVESLRRWRALVASWGVHPLVGRTEDDGRIGTRFTLPAGEGVALSGEHAGERVDWYSFDLQRGAAGATVERRITSALPVRVRFPGMPASRWWDIEEEALSLAELEAGPEDMVRMLALELMTSFADDWYVIPVRLPSGSLARVRSFRVHDVFHHGKPRSVAAFAQQDGDGRTFRMFELAGQPPLGPTAADPGPWLFAAPVVADLMQSPPVEEVRIVRDEASNVGWAVEQLVEGPDGRSRRRAPGEAADRREAPAGWEWQLVSTVPPGWIPLALEESGRLRRARVPGWGPEDGAKSRIVPPGFTVFPEEIPPAGMVVANSWQRTRGANGEVLLWYGRATRPAQPEPIAELVFDRLLRGDSGVPTQPSPDNASNTGGSIKATSIVLEKWEIVPDGGKLLVKYDNRLIARLAVDARDRLRVFQNCDGNAPFFYFNDKGEYGVHPAPPAPVDPGPTSPPGSRPGTGGSPSSGG